MPVAVAVSRVPAGTVTPVGIANVPEKLPLPFAGSVPTQVRPSPKPLASASARYTSIVAFAKSASFAAVPTWPATVRDVPDTDAEVITGESMPPFGPLPMAPSFALAPSP